MTDFVYQDSVDLVYVVCKFRPVPKCSCGYREDDCHEPISVTETKSSQKLRQECIYDGKEPVFPKHNTALTSDCNWRKKFRLNYFRWRGETHGCYRKELETCNGYCHGDPPLYKLAILEKNKE